MSNAQANSLYGQFLNPVPTSPGQLHLGFTETYFNSSENLSSQGGSALDLPNAGQFQEFQSRFMADWDLSSTWRFRSQLDMSFVQSKTSTYSRENFHLDKVGVGVERWGTLGSTPIILYAQGLIPLHSPDLNSLDAFGTDGAMNADLGIYTRPRVGSFIGNFGVGYKWRGENLSHLMPWNLGLGYGFGVGHVGGGLRGFQTLVKDSSSAQERTSRSTAIQNGQAGSLTYLSVDPQVQQAFVDSRWGIFRGLDVSTDFAYDLNGQSYGRGFYVGVGVHWLVDLTGFRDYPSGGPSSKGGSSRSYPYSSPPSSDFQPEGDRYQESLFEGTDPSRAPRPKSPRRPPPRQKSIKQMLDDAESDLEP